MFAQKNSYLQGSVGGVTSHHLKLIAIVTMVIDHAAYLFIPPATAAWWIVHFFGRFAAPVICFVIAEGHHHTSNRKRYLMRLLLFAALSHLPYVLYFDIPFWRATSVIWALAMGLTALMAATNPRFPIFVKTALVLACCLLAYNANWNYIAVLWIVNFGVFRGDFRKQMLGFFAIGFVFYILMGIPEYGAYVLSYRAGVFVPIVLFYLYNGQLGRKSPTMKWVFYWFYPLHLVVFYLLKLFVFNGFA